MTRHAFVLPLAALLIAPALASQSPQAVESAQLHGDIPPPNAVWVDSLDLRGAPIRRPRPQRGANGAPAVPPAPLIFRLSGTAYPHGLPLVSDGDVTIALEGRASRFVAMIGVDDGLAPPPGAAAPVPPPPGSVVFGVWVDGKKAFESDVMKRGDTPRVVSVDLAGAKTLVLAVADANDGTAGDTADWAGAAIVMTSAGQAPPRIAPPAVEALPAIASSGSAVPTINYPRITGATPGRPFLFKIPASGGGPLTFSAKGLPAGVTLDAATGVITGRLEAAGRTDVAVSVKNATGGTSNAIITIVGGDHRLALTPPLGWNSWNVWGPKVDDGKVRAAADGLVNSGLAAQGYTYVNIDDAWEGPRTAAGEITSNEKFPDMKALTDYVHRKGLKIGLYSSPGPRTCQQRYAGSYQHEAQDARTWAAWGFDYIKYDWCSYSDVEPLAARAPLESLQKPYHLMRGILDTLDRDFVFSLCQYGWGSVWEWGKDVGGNLWRVTGDITDTWPSMSSIGFQQTGHEAYAGPGGWNDTDMLVVGNVGWGRADEPRPTNLTPDEQLTHISLWALQAAPLIIGADLSHADPFTIDVLGNREVLAIDQDPLGTPAHRVQADHWTQVWARPLADGTVAVGLFNRGPVAAPVSVTFADIGITARTPPIRFPWTHEVNGVWSGSGGEWGTAVPRHGVVLLRVGNAQASRAGSQR